jgi:hypothetical protein
MTAPGARLSANLQALLSRLQLPVAAQRRAAVDEAAKLPVEEYAPLYEALLERARRRAKSEAMSSAMELTQKQPTSWPAFAAALKDIPPSDIPISLPVQLATVGKDRSELPGLLDHWEARGNASLKKAVTEARKALP